MTTTVKTKSAKQIAHEERNASSQAEAAKRRESRMYEGISRGWTHNGRLKVERLKKQHAKRGLKPYEMTYGQASAFEGTSEEGGEMLTYTVPMTVRKFAGLLPVGLSLNGDDEIEGAAGSFIAMVIDRRRSSFTVEVEYVIIDIADADEATMAFQDQIRSLHEKIAELGGTIVQDEMPLAA